MRRVAMISTARFAPSFAVFFGALSLAACKPSGNAAPGLAKAEEDRAFQNVPAPAANGPKLVVLRGALDVVEKPGGKKLGELGPGAVVARSPAPVSTSGCALGWFAVRPKGFVCAVPGATALDASMASIAPPLPDMSRALPYRYGRAKTENVPLYARVPSGDEEATAEPDLSKLLARGEDKDPLGAAANDVPLDERMSASGPPVLLPTGEGIENGKRTAATFFAFAKEFVAPLPMLGDIKAGALRKGSGVAIPATFTIDGAAAPRRFGVMTDGRLVPTDRLKPALGSTWHGLDLDKIGLPVAFVHKLGVHTFSLEHGKALKHDDDLERRTPIPMTGKFRTVEGVKYEESRDGVWLRSQDIITVVKRSKFPEFVTGNQKWIDVSIANQTLTAYEGRKPVYVTLVSTGRDQMKDPATSAATPRGTFKVVKKSVTAQLDTREVQSAFDVSDAPWALEIEGGATLAGTYWGDGIGEASTYHAVLMTPIDAHRVWSWSDPELPEGWSGVTSDMSEASTMVFIRP